MFKRLIAFALAAALCGASASVLAQSHGGGHSGGGGGWHGGGGNWSGGHSGGSWHGGGNWHGGSWHGGHGYWHNEAAQRALASTHEERARTLVGARE